MKHALVLIVTTIASLTGATGLAAEPLEPRRLERVEMPLDQIEQWPAWTQKLTAVSRHEFERRWEASRPRAATPPAVIVESTVFEATLVGDSLAAGVGTVRLRSARGGPAWLALPGMNLAVSSITHDGSSEPVIWGAAPDGKLWVHVDDPTSPQTWAWSLAGQTTAARTSFDIRLPVALATTFRLRSPSGARVSSPQVAVRALPSSPGDQWTIWEAIVGSDGAFRLIVDPVPAAATPPLVSSRRQLKAEIREDHQRFEANFQLEVLGGEIGEVPFEVPNVAEIYSATWGNDVPLAWTSTPLDGPRHLVRVKLPDQQTGTLRQIRLEGIVARRQGSVTTVPQIELQGGCFRSGTMQISVLRPLEVVSLKPRGCRQESPVISNADGETFQFEQLVPGSQVIVEVGRPESTLTAHVLSSLTCDAEEWAWRSEVLWSSKSGSAFQLALRVPAGWEVTDVSPVEENGPGGRISWELSPDVDGASRIAIELLEALTPDRPRRINVWAQRTVPESQAAWNCPLLGPQNCQSTTTLTQIWGGRQIEVYADPLSLKPDVSAGTLSMPWSTFNTWSKLRDGNRSGSRWFLTTDFADPPRFSVYPKLAPIQASVNVDVEMKDSLLMETYRVRIRPDHSGPLTRVLIQLSEVGEEITWEVESPGGWQLVSSRIPNFHSPGGGPVANGELWELRLPTIASEEVIVRGTRVRVLTLPCKVGLAFLPQATTLDASVSLGLPDSTAIHAVTRGLEDLGEQPGVDMAAPTANGRMRAWRYRHPNDEIQLISRRTSLQESPCVARLELTSLVAACQEGHDYHRAVATLPSFPRQLRFYFSTPVEIMSVQLDGQSLSYDSTPQFVVPPSQAGESPRELAVVYRLHQPGGFLREQHVVPRPACEDVVWTDCRWMCSVPPSARITEEPRGVRMETPPPMPNWSDRLFGPMSRSTSGVFLPWQASSWKDLATLERARPLEVLSTDAFLTAPPEWRKFVAHATATTGDLQLVTWHSGRLRILGWLTLLATLTNVLTVRHAALIQRNRLAAIWLALWLGAAVVAEAPFAEFVGAVLTGTLLGWLTPRRWLVWHLPQRHRDPIVPVGSTQSFTLPRKLVTTGLILLMWLAGGANGQSLAPEIDPDRVVLVPVNSRGEPSPLIYVSPSTWEWLQSAPVPEQPSIPAILIQEADYQATLGVGQRVSVSANLTVLVLGSDTTVTLPIPVSAIGAGTAQGCRVDNMPAAMTALLDASGFQVSWTRPSQPLSAMGIPTATTHRVQLDWQHAWRREGGLAVFDLGIPLSAVSRLTLGPLPVGSSTEFPSRSEATPLGDSAGIATRIAGMSAGLRVLWRELDVNAEPTEIHVESAEVWDLRAGCVDVRSRTTFRPRTGAARTFILDLPKGSVVRRWTSSAPAEFRYPAENEDGKAGLLEFVEHLAAPTTVDLEYVTPLPTSLGEFQWTGLTWSSRASVKLVSGPRLWAISAPNEVAVNPESLEDSGLVPVSLESVQTQLSDLLIDRPPQAIYQVGNAAAVRFRTALVSPVRRILLWQQTGTVEPDRLKWEIEGELDISGLPVYAHVLTVDRRLIVESISVRERGAERRVRWSESRSASGPGTRITIFLSDPAVDTQRISLTASIPLNGSSPIPLPNVRCEDAQLAGGRLVLRTPTGAGITFAGARGLRELTADGDASSGASSRSPTRIFDQTDPDWRATIRVLSAADVRSTRAAHVISSTDEESVQCTSYWRIPQSRLREPTTIIVPAPWDFSLDPTVSAGVLRVEPGTDGSRNVTVTGGAAVDDASVVLRLTLQRAALVESTLPLPRLVGVVGTDLRQWIGELMRMPQSPLLIADQLQAADAPADWGTSEWREPALAENDRLSWFELPGEQSQAVLSSAAAAPAPVAIEWLEHHLWRDDSGMTLGETHARLSTPTMIASAQFPGDLEFRAAIIGGRVGVTRSESEGLVQISSADGSPFSELLLLWRQRSADRAAPVSYQEFYWPIFPQSTVSQLALTVAPPQGTLLKGTGDWRRGDWIDRSLLRLESLGDQWLLAKGAEEERLQQEYLKQYRATAQRLGAAIDDFRGSDTHRQMRWKAIVDRVNQIASHDIDVTSAVPPNFRSSEVLVDHRDLVYGMLPADAQSVRFWRIDAAWLRWLAAVLVTGFAWPILATLIRPSFGAWWQRHPNLAAAVLGVMWWLCLAPSIVGCAIVMAAAYRGATATRTPVVDPILH